MKIVLIDNYDSFTFNVYHYLKNLKCTVKVLRNDKFTLEQIKNFDKIHTAPILDKLGLKRYCCRRNLITNIDMMEII